MEQRLTIIGLGVNDLQESNDFYEKKFGWNKLDSSNDNIAFFKLNGILLSLYPREKLAEDAKVSAEGNGFKGFSLAYNARTKEEVDKTISDLSRKGVRVVKKAENVFWGGYSGYIADPDGNLWEIAFNPYLSLDRDGNVID